MITTERFEQELHQALTHLYDYDYQPAPEFCHAVGCGPGASGLVIQSAIFTAISNLKPATDTPGTARPVQIYALLHNRFVLGLTQEETADRLHVGRTSINRIQRIAIHTLARTLWGRNLTHKGPEDKAAPESNIITGETRSASNATAAWHIQAKQELATLLAIAPDAVSNVTEVIDSVLKLERGLLERQSIRIDLGYTEPDLMAGIHPTVLRQMLITAIEELTHHTSSGQITIFSRMEGANAKITLATAIAERSNLTRENLISNVLAAENVSVDTYLDSNRAFLWIEIPSGKKITVLAVDDNSDIVRFYQRTVEGTRYKIESTAQGQDPINLVETMLPDIIVLDIMLPGADGWKILTHLHENPKTRSIPIIVCSVVRAEALALSLGAALYLPKPASPLEFIQALDQVLPQTAT